MASNPVEDGLNAAQAEGQGVWRLSVIHYSGLPAIKGAGGPLAQSVNWFLHNVANRPCNKPMRCLTCGASFMSKQLPEGLAVMSPHVSGTERHFVVGLCRNCFELPDIKKRVCSTLASRFSVGLRIIDIHPSGIA